MSEPVPNPAPGGTSRLPFLTAFLRARRTVGAVAPTSRGLARRMAAMAGASEAYLIAEFGPGTGAITRELLAVLPADARLWAFEVYPPFVAHLQATMGDPRLTVLEESAEGITELRERKGLPGFDAVVSALPFSLMSPDQASRILRAAARALRPGGALVALQYHPRYLAPLLRAEFGTVEQEVYLWNVPPALLLRSRSPEGLQ